MSKIRNKGGFTLIELLVVIVIMAILMAIAIPTLLNQRQKAWDTAAKSNVTNLYKSAKAEYIEGEEYNGTNLAAALAAEPSIDSSLAAFPAVTADADVETVYVTNTDDQTVVLSAKSKSDKVFTLTAVETGSSAGVTKTPTGW